MAPHRVIIDTDPGVDDVLALLLLFASPEIIIEAITVTFGNTTQPFAFTNVLKVYHLVRSHLNDHPEDKAHFPNFGLANKTILAKGSTGPVEGHLDLAEYFHGPDGLSDITNTHTEFDLPPDSLSTTSTEDYEISSKPADEVIASILEREPTHTVTILALGPLTNVARLLQKSPDTLARVRRIAAMGGALDAPGNTSPSAEFNFFADPFAADLVLRAATHSRFPLFLLPLDITSQHAIPFEKLIKGPTSPSSSTFHPLEDKIHAFLNAILARPRKVIAGLGVTRDSFEMHDPLAAWFVIQHADVVDGNALSSGWTVRKRQFVIERMGEWTKGMCIVDRRGTLEKIGNIRSEDGMMPAPVIDSRPVDNLKPEEIDPNSRVISVKIVTRTPGLDVFEKVFLERVYRGVPVVE